MSRRRSTSGMRFIFGINSQPMKFKGFRPSGNPFRGGILMQEGGPIVDPMGQWRNPYKETIVPTQDGRITMQGVPYPVLGIDETGMQQMMYPNQEYQFRGKNVFEKPLFQKGGTKPPIILNDKDEFVKKDRAYKDSLNAFNIGNNNWEMAKKFSKKIDKDGVVWYDNAMVNSIPNTQKLNTSLKPLYYRFTTSTSDSYPNDPVVDNFDANRDFPIYKKPVQPYVYKEPEYFLTKTPNILIEQTPQAPIEKTYTLGEYPSMDIDGTKVFYNPSNKEVYLPNNITDAEQLRELTEKIIQRHGSEGMKVMKRKNFQIGGRLIPSPNQRLVSDNTKAIPTQLNHKPLVAPRAFPTEIGPARSQTPAQQTWNQNKKLDMARRSVDGRMDASVDERGNIRINPDLTDISDGLQNMGDRMMEADAIAGVGALGYAGARYGLKQFFKTAAKPKFYSPYPKQNLGNGRSIQTVRENPNLAGATMNVDNQGYVPPTTDPKLRPFIEYKQGGVIAKRQTRENPYINMQLGGMSLENAYKFLFDDEEEETSAPITAPSEKEIEELQQEQFIAGQKEAAKKYARQLRQMKNNQAAMQLIQDNPELNFDNYISRNRSINSSNNQSRSSSELKGTSRERATEAVNYLQQAYGLPKHVAAGIAGNAVLESSFSDSVISGKKWGDNNNSFGLFQWNGSRHKNFFNWAKQNNKNPYDVYTQLDYGVIEAKQRGDLQATMKAKTAEEAANIWRDRFERPLIRDSKRAFYANQLMKYRLGGEKTNLFFGKLKG